MLYTINLSIEGQKLHSFVLKSSSTSRLCCLSELLSDIMDKFNIAEKNGIIE